jgi:hypothetical protein
MSEVPRQYDLAPEQRPYADIYMPADEPHILKEGGHHEMPFMATRFTRFGNQVFGSSPLLGISDTIDDLMAANDVVKLLGERAAMPSVVLPADMEGEVDMRAETARFITECVWQGEHKELMLLNVKFSV